MSERFQIGEFYITQRKDSPKFYATWFDRKSRQTRSRSLGTTDFQEAKEKLAEFHVNHVSLNNQAPEDVPLSVIFLRYYEKHAKHTASEEAARISLDKWSDFYAGKTVSDLTLDSQNAFIDSLKKAGGSPNYINRIFSVAIAALNFAYKRQEITSMPFVQLPPKGPGRDRVLRIEETAELFNATIENAPQVFVYLMIAFNTMARPDAIKDLTPAQVDFEHGIIKLNPDGRIQTKKYRPIVPMTNTLRAWLEEFKEHDLNGGDYYVNYYGNKIKSIKKGFANLKTRAGIEDTKVVPYTIRHTMASEMRKRGVPKWDVEGFLGHQGDSTTDKYAHYDPTYLQQAVGAIDDYFQELNELVDYDLC